MFQYHRPVILALLFGLLLILRLTAPSDLLEGDQNKQVGYVMDILHHGNWLLQYEITGEVSTKPPLYNWLAAATCLIFDTHAEWAMKLPSLLAAIGLLICLYSLGQYFFDERAAFYACMSCIASHHFSKLMWFARTDMLVSFLVLLAITLTVRVRWYWWKTFLVGFVVGLSFLAKGPIGPALCLSFLLAWGWHHDALRSTVNWRRFAPGAAFCLVLCLAWLIAVWQMPRFEQTAVQWQLGQRMLDPEKAKPFYYYLGHVVTRVAPWPLLAGIGYWLSRKRTEATTARFVLVWFLAFFVLFSLIPVKRHDHLMPVYPAMFLLAGLGLRYLVEPVLRTEAFWVMYPLSAVLVASPILVPFVKSLSAAWIISGSFVCGAASGWCFLKRQRISMAVVAAGLVCAHGIYHHCLNQLGRADYDQLRQFANKIRGEVPPEDKVVVFYAHPLIAYELDQHVRIQDPQELQLQRPQWVIMPDYFADMITEKTNWRLHSGSSLTIPPREDRATLFRVEPPAALSSHPERTVR